MHDFGYFEEDKLGKPYDVRLLRRLYPYAGPYWRLYAAAIVFVVLITLVELAIPYVTKIAIDRYIVPGSAKTERSGPAPGTGPAASGDVSGAKSEGRRFLTVSPVTPEIRGILDRYPGIATFKTDPETNETAARIPYKDLKKIETADLTRLRRDDLSGVAVMALIFLGLIVFQFVFNFCQVMIMEWAAQRIMYDMRLKLFSHIQELSVAFFNRNSVGRLVTRTTNDIQNLYEMFTSVITFVFKDVFLLVGIAVVLLSIDWKLALVSFTVIPFVLWAAFVFAHHARDAFRVLKIKLAEINTRFSETIGGVKVIQAFRQERRNYRRFKVLNHENYEAGMRQIHVFAIFMPVIELLGSVAIAIVIFYGGGGVLGGSITLGALVAFISYMKMFFRPIRDIAEKYNIMQNAMASAERIFLILDSRDRVPDPPADRAAPPPERIDSLQFEDVSFEYLEGEPVLKGISFSLRAGESVAVVGPTGAGKTSLINLITRFYDPQGGRVRVNGRDIREMATSALRSRMALVTQDPFLFSGTIRGNIQPVEAPLSDEEMTSVLAAANCKGLVDRLPRGLDTELSEGGASISSGERQLLSIARAFARDPDLILLDEATSYIDSETEAHIQEALWNLMRDRTAILVAHRLSTARQADRILVVHRGRIIESGAHETLMATGGFYYRLHQLNGG